MANNMNNIIKIGSAAFQKYGENITLQQLAQAEEDGLWCDPEIEQWKHDNEQGCDIYSFAGHVVNKVGYKRLPKIQKDWIDKYVKEPIFIDGVFNINECVRAKWRWEADHGMYHGDWDDIEAVTKAASYYSLNPNDLTLHIPASEKEKINKIKDTKETHTKDTC